MLVGLQAHGPLGLRLEIYLLSRAFNADDHAAPRHGPGAGGRAVRAHRGGRGHGYLRTRGGREGVCARGHGRGRGREHVCASASPDQGAHVRAHAHGYARAHVRACVRGRLDMGHSR